MKKKYRIGLLSVIMLGSSVVYSADLDDSFKQIKKGKFEAAVKTQAKVYPKLSSSQDHLLYEIAQCMLYNSPGYTGYNPEKAYKIYNKIQYSDYLYDKKVMLVLREQGVNVDDLLISIENNILSVARKNSSVEYYDHIISLCQGCSYLSDAKRMKEDLLFNLALKNASIRDVEKYLADYPDSPNRAKAEQLRDSLAFNSLKENAGAYSQYISMYPNSKYVPQIKKGLEKMAYDEAKAVGSIGAYAVFIANYPENKNVSEFRKLIDQQQSSLSWRVPAEYTGMKCVVDSVLNKTYFLVGKGGLWGVVGESGNVIIEPEYEDVAELVNGMLVAKKGGKWGLVDLVSAKPASAFCAQSSADFKSLGSKFVAYKENGKWGLLLNGSTVAIQPFVEGGLTEFNSKVLENGSVAMTHLGRIVIANTEGTVIMDGQYDEVKWRNVEDIDSKYIKMREGRNWGLISGRGELVLKPEFDMAPFFDPDGVASVKSFTNEGWIDTTGKKLYYGRLSSFRDCGGDDKMIAYEKDGMFGFIDKLGVNNIPCVYQEVIECFKNGIAKVKKDNAVMFINKAGNVVYTPVAGDKAKIVGDIVVVSGASGAKFIDANATVIALDAYTSIDDEFYNGMVRVSKSGKWGAIDKTGKVVVPIDYEEMTRFCNGYSIVKKNGKFGLLFNGSLVLPAEYDKILDPGHFFDNDCNSFSKDNVSRVVYLTAFEGNSNVKIVMCDGKKVMSTPDEIRLKKLDNGYAIIDVAEFGVFSKAKSGLIGKKGQLLVSPAYSQIKFMNENKTGSYFSYKTLAGKCGVLDQTGKEITIAFADNLTNFNGKVIKGTYGKDKTIFSKSGVQMLPVGYELVNDNIIKNKADGKFGVVNSDGKMLLYPSYNKIISATDDYAVVEKDGKYGVVSFK